MMLSILRLNYFLGGMAAGGVYGAWRRNHVAGLVVGLAFGKLPRIIFL